MIRWLSVLLELVGMYGGWTSDMRRLHPSAYP